MIKRTKQPLKFLGGVAVAASAVMVVTSCGGGSDDGGGDLTPLSTTPAVIDTAGVTKAVADFGNAISICQDGATGAVQSSRVGSAGASIQRSMAALQGRLLGVATKRALALGGTAPADQLGSCGGRYGYRNYSHLSGTTTATLAFEDYCQSGTKAGETQTTNGNIAFVNTGTPSASGPITTQIEASSSGALTTVLKNAAGATISSDTLSLTGFKMVVGVPGGTPTAASPDVMSMTEMTLGNGITGKAYRQTGYRVTGYEDSAGTSTWTMTGRGYRSDGSYFDIATPQPMVQNANGNMVSGQISFTGASGSTAIATVVPGSTLQLKLTVNGTPLTSVPACVK